jgi:hypothetical protein
MKGGDRGPIEHCGRDNSSTAQLAWKLAEARFSSVATLRGKGHEVHLMPAHYVRPQTAVDGLRRRGGPAFS